MNLNNIYFNYFSVASLILIAFNFTLALFLLIIPNKSKSTINLGLSFTFLTIFQLAYFVAYSYYDPAAAFHRWLTVFSILGGLVHINLFIIYFPDERNPGFAKVCQFILYGILIIITGIFIIKTKSIDKIYRFDGHCWDFNADDISKFVGLVIIILVLFFIILTIWRVIANKTGERWLILTVGIITIISGSVPTTFNFLTRDGAISKEVFQVYLDLFHIFGFFVLAMVYINTTKDRTTFMAKIIGVSIVTFMVVLQVLSYYSIQNEEKIYNDNHKNLTRLALKTDYRSSEIKYIMSYSLKDDVYSEIYSSHTYEVDFHSKKIELLNTVLYEKIINTSDENFNSDLKELLIKSHKYFYVYKNAIIQYADKIKSSEKNKGIQTVKYIDDLKRVILYRYNKIKQLPDKNFRQSLQKFLTDNKGEFSPFKDGLIAILDKNRLEDKELKSEIIQYLLPMNSADTRLYRRDIKKDNHYIAFMMPDFQVNKIYEVGFSYLAYRNYVHVFSKILTIILLAVLMLMIIGFPIFLMGSLIKPLNKLLEGVKKVMEGNLNWNVSIKVSDEIGYLTDSFNKMVRTISTSKKELDDYANNLEEKVKVRTEELQSAMEELGATNEALTQTRDELWGEMQLAKKIQTVLLPSKPVIKGFEIAAYMEPANDVGGDYYDIINVENLDWIVIGDVSGHGIPAGLIMMMVQTAIHVVLTDNPGVEPSKLLAMINKTITKNIKQLDEDKYMTITVFAAYKDGIFYFSGLHQDIIIYRAQTDSVELIETDGIWIGIIDDINEMLNDKTFKLNVNDVMFIYTDGITEAWKFDDESGKEIMFGNKKLNNLLYKLGKDSTVIIKDKIIQALEGYKCKDDVTFVVLKRLE